MMMLLVGSLVVAGLTVLVMFRYIKHRQTYGKLILTENLEFDENNAGDFRYFIGKEGVTKTPLKPIGMADFNGQKLEVFADGAFVDVNRRVKVYDVTKTRITVREVFTN